MKPKQELIKAEVMNTSILLNVGNNVYQPFYQGEIVEVDPITFRNLERKGRLKAAAPPEPPASEDNSRKGAKAQRRKVGQVSNLPPAT